MAEVEKSLGRLMARRNDEEDGRVVLLLKNKGLFSTYPEQERGDGFGSTETGRRYCGFTISPFWLNLTSMHGVQVHRDRLKEGRYAVHQ
jgi:hypothetical protein